MKKRFNVIAAAVLALGMVVGMCGCEGQLPQPKTTQRQDAPNLTAKQEKTIRTNILKTLDQCNNDRNIDALGSILEGPELEIRTSELHVAQVTGNLDRKTTIPTDLAQPDRHPRFSHWSPCMRPANSWCSPSRPTWWRSTRIRWGCLALPQ